jgi:hypothetical protein
MKIRILKAFLLVIFLETLSFAGQSAGIFLELPASARAGGMADCFTALSDDPFGAYYNPAGISYIKFPTVSLLYQNYLEDISGNYVSITIPRKNYSINVAPAMIGMKDEPIYDSFGNDTGRKFKYQGTIIPVTGAFTHKNLSFGATAKYYKEEIGSYSKDVITYDAGIIYKFDKLSLGFSGLNLIGKLGDYDLPETFRYGAAFTYRKLNLLFDYVSQLKIQKDYYDIGGEMLFQNIFFVRLGYKITDDFGGLTYGFGIKAGNFDIDYALSSYSDLGSTQRAGITYCFGKLKNENKLLQETANKEASKDNKKSNALNCLCPNVAVSEFTGKNASIADASIVTDFLRTELVTSKYFNVLERTNMDMILAEQKFQLSGCTSEECAVKMGKILNVQGVIIGSLSKLLNTYYISVSFVDVQTGKILKSLDQKATTADELKTACRLIVEKLIQ